MGNELFQARLPDDFAERIHEYREEKHMSKSEAVRDLLRRGLEAEREDKSEEVDGYLERVAQDIVFVPAVLISLIGLVLPYAAIVGLQAGDVLLATFTMVFAVLLMVGGLVVAAISVLAQFALARPLRGLAGFTPREVEA